MQKYLNYQEHNATTHLPMGSFVVLPIVWLPPTAQCAIAWQHMLYGMAFEQAEADNWYWMLDPDAFDASI
jgi:hypothetical protein